MKCACVHIEIDEEGCEFEKIEDRTAKKQHKCCECKRIIEIGEQYENYSGKWNGNFDYFKTCSDCLSVRKSFFCNGHEFTSMYSNLAYHIEYMKGEISSDCITSLTPRARATVCEMIERDWKHMEESEEDER